MLIERTIQQSIIENIQKSHKANIIYGARQVGKTTLVKNIVKAFPQKRVLFIDADQNSNLDPLSSRSTQALANFTAGYDLLIIDEAQRIPEIGINLKILVDHFEKLQIIATGSSSLDLGSKIKESMVGRTWNYTLYPISYFELRKTQTPFELDLQIEDRLIYGSYPEIFSLLSAKSKREYLESIVQSYLYKDILQLADIRHGFKIKDLLRLLAFQIGNQVSLSELASSLSITKETVARYLYLLEESFVIFRLSGFSRNLRKEVKKMDKIYFYDLGIRNILINNMNNLSSRNDIGQLWENFLMVERLKYCSYTHHYANRYFWRTHTGAELDYVEEKDGSLFGYEIKWGSKKVKPPATWLATYQNASFNVVNRDNYLPFIT